MKRLLTYVVFFVTLSSTGFSQLNNPSDLGLIDKLPLTISAGIYLDSLMPGKIVGIVSQKVKVALSNSVGTIQCKHLFLLNNAIIRANYSELEYSVGDSWKPISLVTTDGYILDTSLKPGDSTCIRFRRSGSVSILQSTILKRINTLPTITASVTLGKYDTLPGPTFSATHKILNEIRPNFIKLNSNSIIIPAGKLVAFQISRINESRDSCLYYRIISTTGDTIRNWTSTGHILNIEKLPANANYIVDLKYSEADRYKRYTILVLPYWFQKPTGLVLIFFLVVLAVSSCWYFVNRYRRRKRTAYRRLLEEQTRSLQSRLNPHFTFNVLNSIGGMVAVNDIERANLAINRFAEILRNTLLHSEEMFIPLAEDVSHMETYIELEQLRTDFKINISVHPSLDLENIEFPPMLIQPAVENAIKHGVTGMGKEGLINLTYDRNDADLIITVTDNGKGLYEDQLTKGTGRGVAIIKDRIAALEGLYPEENISFETTRTNEGTVVRFTFSGWL